MVEIEALEVPVEFPVPDTIRTARAEALFLSTLQPSEAPSPDRVRRQVATMLSRLGLAGCGAQMADEYGDHPYSSVARMRWALAMIDRVYPMTWDCPAPHRRPLAAAS